MNQYELGIQQFIDKIRKQIKLKEQDYLYVEKALISRIINRSPQPQRTIEIRANNFLDVKQKRKHPKTKSNPLANRSLNASVELEPLPPLLLTSKQTDCNKRISLRIPTVLPEQIKKLEQPARYNTYLDKPQNLILKEWTVESSDDNKIF